MVKYMKDSQFRWFVCIILCLIPIALIHVCITPGIAGYVLFFKRLVDTDNVLLYLLSIVLLVYSAFKFLTSGKD